jgi:type I restriction enzyme M protein
LDASKEFKTGRAQNELLPQHVEHIHQWYRDFKNVEGVALVVTLEEIANNDNNLNIPRYVEPKSEETVMTVAQATKRLRKSGEATFEAEDKLITILEHEGLFK